MVFSELLMKVYLKFAEKQMSLLEMLLEGDYYKFHWARKVEFYKMMGMKDLDEEVSFTPSRYGIDVMILTQRFNTDRKESKHAPVDWLSNFQSAVQRTVDIILAKDPDHALANLFQGMLWLSWMECLSDPDCDLASYHFNKYVNAVRHQDEPMDMRILARVKMLYRFSGFILRVKHKFFDIAISLFDEALELTGKHCTIEDIILLAEKAKCYSAKGDACSEKICYEKLLDSAAEIVYHDDPAFMKHCDTAFKKCHPEASNKIQEMLENGSYFIYSMLNAHENWSYPTPTHQQSVECNMMSAYKNLQAFSQLTEFLMLNSGSPLADSTIRLIHEFLFNF